jgi:anaerobic ribonucleoside-triphosphate reductase
MDMINMELFKLFEEGDANGNIFQYPIPTINIVKNFDWDTPVMKQILKVTAKYGIPYWSNFVNSDLNPDDVRSMCVTSDSTVRIRTNEPWVKITHDDGRIEYLPESKAKEFF